MDYNYQSLNSIYGLNAEEELTNLLSNELSKQIDKRIVCDMIIPLMKNDIDINIRESNINITLDEDPYTDEEILEKSMDNLSILPEIESEIYSELIDYIKEKRGTN